MIFHVMTLFEEMFDQFKKTSIIGRAINNGLIDIKTYNIRNFSLAKSKSVDDYVYGGGEGMLIQAEPIYNCYKSFAENENIKTLYLSPRGRVLDNDFVKELAKEKEIVLLCGHYEGVDKRALTLINATEVSIGDYVLTGGELPAMVFIDAVSRFVDGVLSNDSSNANDSFNNNLLECDQYTRPFEYMGLKVPEILLSGDHKKVNDWKLKNSIEITKKNRPDIYNNYILVNGGKNE